MALRTVAVDWSGRASGAGNTTWVGEVSSGTLVSLHNGRAGRDLESDLCELAAATPLLAVGLDFAFSFPAWYVEALGLRSAFDLWELAEHEGERWLADCQSPFWGRPGRPRPDLSLLSPHIPLPPCEGIVGSGAPLSPAHFRRTDREVPATGSNPVRPKSPFQIGGAGSVGTGSVRGMASLSRLRRAGFRVWPFDPDGWPRLLEIYPRWLTGPVRKSDPAARKAYLNAQGWPAAGAGRRLAASSEDAFDAALSARAMDTHQASLLDPPGHLPPEAAMEGWIWSPLGAAGYPAPGGGVGS